MRNASSVERLCDNHVTDQLESACGVGPDDVYPSGPCTTGCQGYETPSTRRHMLESLRLSVQIRSMAPTLQAYSIAPPTLPMFHTTRTCRLFISMVVVTASCSVRDGEDAERYHIEYAASSSTPLLVPRGSAGSESVGFVVAADAVTQTPDGRCELRLWPSLQPLIDARRELLSHGWQSASPDFAQSAKTLPFCPDAWPPNRMLAQTTFSGSGFLVAPQDIRGLALKVQRHAWNHPAGYDLYPSGGAPSNPFSFVPSDIAQDLEVVREWTNRAWFVTAGHVVTQTTPAGGRYEFHGKLYEWSKYTRNMRIIFGLENIRALDPYDNTGALALDCDQIFTPTHVVTAVVTQAQDTLMPASDFAVLILDRPLPPERPGLRISQAGTRTQTLPTPRTPVRMMGFPFSLVPMQLSEGSIVDVDADSQWFRYALAATGGFSGSPIIALQDDIATPLALGVHVVGEALTYRTETIPAEMGYFPLHCLRPGARNDAWSSSDGRFGGCVHPVLPGQERSNLIAANHCHHITQDGQLCFVDNDTFRLALASGPTESGCLAFAPVDLGKGLRIARHSPSGCEPEYYSFYPKATSMQLIKSAIQHSSLLHLADDILSSFTATTQN
jgi:hypothetical protein